jgi:site-specific recombinase XerD
MEEFKAYLKTRYDYTAESLELKNDQIQIWKKHLTNYQTLENIGFKELLKIIEIFSKNYQISTLNNLINTLKSYFYFLIEIQKREDNPLENFKIKSNKPPLLQGFLTEEELQFIYENYPEEQKGKNSLYLKRNKILLGLMIFQGLTTGDLEVLKITDVDLKKAQISVPKATERKGNPRVLQLQASQILTINDYLNCTRNKLIIQVRADKTTLDLFPKREKSRMKDVVKTIKPDIEKYFKINTLNQFRISRIALWLKQYNAREVQYKSGYKYLSSLEKYHLNELESLKEAVNKYHIF